jgi:hypothetical protein
MTLLRNHWPTVALLALFALSRWPGLLPLNFSMAYALAFCAAVFPRRLPWWSVVAVMLATDLPLNAYYHQPLVSDFMLITYAGFALVFALGRFFPRRAAPWKLIGGGVAGALLFYLVTNTLAWFFNPFRNPEYTRDLAGWLIALTKGTGGWPETWTFLRNTLLGGGLFTGVIAGLFQHVEASEPEPEEAEEPDADGELAGEER